MVQDWLVRLWVAINNKKVTYKTNQVQLFLNSLPIPNQNNLLAWWFWHLAVTPNGLFVKNQRVVN